jgi:hypothetical protein
LRGSELVGGFNRIVKLDPEGVQNGPEATTCALVGLPARVLLIIGDPYREFLQLSENGRIVKDSSRERDDLRELAVELAPA